MHGFATETQTPQNGYLCSQFNTESLDFERKYCKNLDVTDNNTHEYHLKPLYVMNDRFHREDERLKTYDKWPLDWMDKYQLARTGMFFTGDCDKVKCYFCEVEIGRWERDDEPVGEHIKWSPNCPLLRRRTTNNVPVSTEAIEQLLPPISYDICGANDATSDVVRPFSYAEGVIPTTHMLSQDHNTINATVISTISSISSFGNGSSCNQAYFPEYPEYAIEAARVRSFAEWPRHMKQKPHQLAEAGFFYTGIGDRVKCFSCGGGLKDWYDGDDPWEQHAIWLSKCRFLKLIKGESYIDSVLAQQKDKDAHQECHGANEAASTGDRNKILNANAFSTIISAQGTTKPLNVLNPTMATGTASMNVTAVCGRSSNVGNIRFESSTNSTNVSQICDVVPQTAAVRIYDKIMGKFSTSEPTKETISTNIIGNTLAIAATPTNTIGSDSCERKFHAQGGVPEEKLCKICYASEYNTAFLPCGHVVACAKCASSVTKCPLCRKLFTDVMRVYFS